jgi:hypothetical protein
MPRLWQEIDAQRLSCHWWQERDDRTMSAMIVLAFVTLSLLGAGLVRWARRDRFSARAVRDVFR